MNTNALLPTLTRDGTSQEDRTLASLDPEHAKIDDRQIEDLLYYAWQHAAELNFYSQNEVPDGNWQEFLNVEPSIALAVIGKQSAKIRENRFLESFKSLDDIDTEKIEIDHKNPQAWQVNLQSLFESLAAYLYEIKEWMNLLRDNRDSKLMIKGFAKSHICPHMHEVISLYRGFFDVSEDDFTVQLEKTLTDFSYVSLDDIAPNNIVFSLGSVSEKIYAVKEPILRLYKILTKTRTQIQSKALNEMHVALAKPADKKPHVGLFLSFIELFEASREKLNKLSEKHLNYYYQKILQIEPQKGQEDSLNILIETKEKLREMIPEGTQFNAGKDDDGNDIFYALMSNFYPSSALVTDIKNLHLETNNDGSQSIHAAQVANSADGQGEELPEDEPHWSTFGDKLQELADVGFAVSSPVLRLAEGQRKITLSLAVDDFLEEGWQLFFQRYAKVETNDGASDWVVDFSKFLSFQFSGENYWLDIEPLSVEIQSRETAVFLVVEFDLLPEHPAIIDYNKEMLAGNYSTPWPIMCCKLVYFDDSFPYDIFKNIKIRTCRIDVEVAGVTNLVVQSNDKVQKALEPFAPFTGFPQLGSTLYIGSQEVFSKKIDSLKVNWLWQNPPESFQEHYQAYTNATDEKAEFKVDCSYLQDGQWTPLANQATLMENKKVHVDYYGDWQIQNPEASFMEFAGLTEDFETLNEYSKYDFKAKRGFLKMQLAAPSFAFGHKLYPKLYAIETRERAVEEAQRISSEQHRESREELEHSTMIGRLYDKIFSKQEADVTTAPAQERISFDAEGNIVERKLKKPYDPIFNSLSLDYSSSAEISIHTETQNDPIDFLHLQPFGFESLELSEESTSQPLLPQFDSEGYLYVGLENIKVPQNISLLFQVLENSENPYVHKASSVTYSYLTDKGWSSLEGYKNIDDQSLGLLQSGILSFEMPENAVDTNPYMPLGKYWLRISQDRGIAAIPRLIGIHTQAAKLKFASTSTSPHLLGQALPAGSISSMEGKSRQIDSLEQPYVSFGGKAAEKPETYRRRVSERLRHKGHALTLWDYEHLALEFFPELCKAKCLNHTNGDLAIVNGSTCLVVVPDTRNPNAFDLYRPAVNQSTLQRVEDFFKSRTSPFVNFSAINPVYESIQLKVSVVLREGHDQGYSVKMLNKDLSQFISPWAVNKGLPVIGGELHRSTVIKFIEDRDYIDFINIENISMIHTTNEGSSEHSELVKASTPASILYSVSEHIIQVETGENR
ncbi:MAG: hypothetical protein NE334_03940 [Lentisphaeraceae bacterium]|nr:hypothetical protein [Lentisphaeraceae bacterium]